MRKVIAMIATNSWREFLETAVKSIVYNNSDVDIYVLNRDVAPEFIFNINRKIEPLGSRIFDIKLDPYLLEEEGGSDAALSLLVPKYVKVTADRILFIDADTIVNKKLDTLFTMDLKGAPIAAVKDLCSKVDQLNSGVVIFNNYYFTEHPDEVDKLWEYAKTHELRQEDQTVLTDFYHDSYYHLDFTYNTQIGFDSYLSYFSDQAGDHYFEEVDRNQDPVIIHYLNEKPWNQVSGGRLRHKWWQYADLEWSDIKEHRPLLTAVKQCKYSLYTLTYDAGFNSLDDLVRLLPDVEFNICAYTKMIPDLLRFGSYPNVHLYPLVSTGLRKELIKKADGYLDTNYGLKDNENLQQFVDSNKPIFAFEDTQWGDKPDKGYYTFPNDNAEQMANEIEKILAINKH